MLLNPTSAELKLINFLPLLIPSFLVSSRYCTVFFLPTYLLFPVSFAGTFSSYQSLDVGVHEGSALFFSHTHLSDFIQPQGIITCMPVTSKSVASVQIHNSFSTKFHTCGSNVCVYSCIPGCLIDTSKSNKLI